MVAPVNQEGDNAINIELGEKEAEGIYSNLVLVSHSPHEFVIDFARLLPGVPKAKVGARIVTTPSHMVSLIQTLQENLTRYERAFGPVQRRG
ncbi:MAG TPA: DUF3467 domain-containing protein [Fibrobacteria bacterium]|jgi:hypothetical protein|nr:DUF3467 domain-containing protein [Fibrobacteria bacterium]